MSYLTCSLLTSIIFLLSIPGQLCTCLPNCISCPATIRCDLCASGYYLWKGISLDQCIICPKNVTYCWLDYSTGMLITQQELNSTGIAGNQGWSSNSGM